MSLQKIRNRLWRNVVLMLLVAGVIGWTTRYWVAQAAPAVPGPGDGTFENLAKPFFEQNCMLCHNTDTATAGIRVDQLDGTFEDRHIRAWENIRTKISDGTMPPEGMPQPTAAERTRMVEFITRNIEAARVRQAPKNGLIRRLTIAQYRNSLQELLGIDDDLTTGIPPDAVSRDGFVNNQETLNLSTQLLEEYLQTADEALSRAIIDPKTKPSIQDFRMEFGKSINPEPFPGQLVLGAGSALLNNQDFMVTEPVPTKPFAFDPHPMQRKYRYIEGYQGNDTVRGWRDFDSIYHAVFADMRGSNGYPKGRAYDLVPEGLLLRPAIPNDEIFGADGTEGPKANFKISTRELPDTGRFRITVMAARYDDGLMLDAAAKPQAPGAAQAMTVAKPAVLQTVNIPKAGIYQVDLHAGVGPAAPITADASHLNDGLAVRWLLDGGSDASQPPARLEGKAQFSNDAAFGKVIAFDRDGDSLIAPRTSAANVGTGDFSVSLWVRPDLLRDGGLVSVAPTVANMGTESTQNSPFSHGWYVEMDRNGSIHLQTAGADTRTNGSVLASVRGAIKVNTWHHVAIVVHRAQTPWGITNTTRLYVNGYQVGKGDVGPADLDEPKADLVFGRTPNGKQFRGQLHDFRIYRRALGEAEIQALLQPGQQFVVAPPLPAKPPVPELNLSLGDRHFSGSTLQTAFLAVRLDAGPLKVSAQTTAMEDLASVVLTPLADSDENAKKFLAFEKRSPMLGVRLGFRRDCGSTFAQVGPIQTVANGKLSRYVFEGTLKNYPNPEVEKDNVNYLAGVREIAVHSEYTDGRDMPRLEIRSVEFEGPFYDTWPAPSYKSIFIDSPHANDPPTYSKEILRSFATRAYRRPVTSAELESLMVVYRRASTTGRNFQDSVKDALEVVLTSPQFLFLTENSASPAPEPLDEYELASKLSYFLWNGPPDRTTLGLAARGQLHKQLDSEVTRLTEDPKFLRFITEFTSQWLNLDKFTVLEPDRKLYPQLTRDTRTQLRQEPIEYVGYLLRNNLPVRNLVRSDFIVTNETVAGYYGLGDKVESGYQFVALKPERPELGGVLTEAAIMAGLSDGRESNPVKRGAWLARKIIAEPPADPPPNVPALKADTAHTLRERIEQHRNQPGCRQCHAKIDPWGIAFEEFDAGGRLKVQTVDAHSTLPDKTEVSGANDLKRYLSEDRIDQVAYSVMKHLATYATGRTLTFNELNVMRQEEGKLKADGYRMKDMIRFVVNSKMFLEK